MPQDAGQASTCADDVAILAEEVAESCILAIEVFKHAAALLFGPDRDVANHAIQTADTCASISRGIHSSAVNLLARWAPTGDDLRRIVDLQRAAAACARIAEHGQRVAQHALALPNSAEQELALIGGNAPDVLARLVRQVYVALRGCLLLVTTRERALARRLISEDAELDRLHQILKLAIDHAVSLRPQSSPTLHRVLFVLAELRQMGTCVVSICEDRLYVPMQGPRR